LHEVFIWVGCKCWTKRWAIDTKSEEEKIVLFFCRPGWPANMTSHVRLRIIRNVSFSLFLSRVYFCYIVEPFSVCPESRFTVQDVVWCRMNSYNENLTRFYNFLFDFWRWRVTRTRQRVVEEARGWRKCSTGTVNWWG